MTGVTREKAAETAANFFGTSSKYTGGVYNAYQVEDRNGRIWKFVRDASIDCQRKQNGRKVAADTEHSVEMVTPICQYSDIETVQELLRQLRHAGAFVNESCGVHIHINAAPFDAKKLRNLVNIVASKEDMVYRALQVDQRREIEYCQKIDPSFLEQLNRSPPHTMEQFSRLWYGGESRSHNHYDYSRYHCLNLHSVFQKGTIEFRAFNSSIHAGKIKAYIQFCLAITAQAYNQRSASPIKTVSENERYTFRTWLLRLGLIGDEFKTARHHLLEHLDGNIAWRDPAQGERQRERLREARRETEISNHAVEDFLNGEEPTAVQPESAISMNL